MQTKPQKLAAKRRKAKSKKSKLASKLKGKSMKHTAIAALAAAAILSGCQTADPASRSNRSSYRDIYAEINGCSNLVTITIGDGLYASADGGGDRQDSSAAQTTDTKPELAVGVGGGSAGTGGAQPSSGIVGAALEKLMGIVGGTAAKGAALTPSEAQAISAACAAATAQP